MPIYNDGYDSIFNRATGGIFDRPVYSVTQPSADNIGNHVVLEATGPSGPVYKMRLQDSCTICESHMESRPRCIYIIGSSSLYKHLQ